MTAIPRSTRILMATLLLTLGLPTDIGHEGLRFAWTTKDRLSLCEFVAGAERAYSKGQFGTAWKRYMHVRAGFPMPSAQLMTGETALRLVLRYDRERAKTLPPGQCATPNDDSGRWMGRLLNSHYRPGLMLADRESIPSPRMAALYQHSRKVAACLKALEAEYTAKPASACVDLTALSDCLGPPLAL